MGAWFEAKILEVVRDKGSKHGKSQASSSEPEDSAGGSHYEDDVVELTSKDIRPRARHVIKFENVKEGQTIMANYNYDEPNTRGFWYDCLVTKKRDTRTMKELYATVYIGADLMPLENCRLLFLTELFEVEKPGTQLTEQDLLLDPTASPAKRKHDPEKQLMCDECDQAYHLDCLNPPLTAIPDEDEWYCPSCKRDENEVVKAGEKLKESKKKSKMASATGTSNRDWGKVSEAGVHRPHVAGIHGREDDGAYSIVLSGGYEDDAVVKYWAEKGKSGFLVWRYLLRRDDPAPAPWTKEGKKRAEELDLTMQYPEGYLESQAEKEKEKEKEKGSATDESEEDASPKKRGRKRKADASPAIKEESKRAKKAAFKVDADIMKLIKADKANKKLWDEALAYTSEGKQKFLQQLEEVFMCICCQEILYKPVTLQCSHNFCKPCITRSFKAEVYSCPACRTELPKDISMAVNKELSKVLNHFYPGYEAGRE
nr:hypothetical protein BaRGS_031293 [Batillaria attramentaria]